MKKRERKIGTKVSWKNQKEKRTEDDVKTRDKTRRQLFGTSNSDISILFIYLFSVLAS